MNSLLNFEKKIVGNNIIWIMLLLLCTLTIICLTSGGLVDWGYLGFEVLLPFFYSDSSG